MDGIQINHHGTATSHGTACHANSNAIWRTTTHIRNTLNWK